MHPNYDRRRLSLTHWSRPGRFACSALPGQQQASEAASAPHGDRAEPVARVPENNAVPGAESAPHAPRLHVQKHLIPAPVQGFGNDTHAEVLATGKDSKKPAEQGVSSASRATVPVPACDGRGNTERRAQRGTPAVNRFRTRCRLSAANDFAPARRAALLSKG